MQRTEEKNPFFKISGSLRTTLKFGERGFIFTFTCFLVTYERFLQTPARSHSVIPPSAYHSPCICLRLSTWVYTLATVCSNCTSVSFFLPVGCMPCLACLQLSLLTDPSYTKHSKLCPLVALMKALGETHNLASLSKPSC